MFHYTSKIKLKTAKPTSNTVLLMILLTTFYFLFLWNQINSTLTGTCYPYIGYWGSLDGEQWSVYTVTFWGFFFIGVLLVLEFIKGVRKQVRDRKVCLIGNGFMIIFVALCLFVLMKQHQFMMLQSHDVSFNYVQTNDQTPNQTTRNQFQSDWKERYCQSIKARNQYPEFNRQRFCSLLKLIQVMCRCSCL